VSTAIAVSRRYLPRGREGLVHGDERIEKRRHRPSGDLGRQTGAAVHTRTNH
jgi:hypothetical protein